MDVINVNQRSVEWHEWRSKGVTASQMPAILSQSPYETPWGLWAIKTGRLAPPDLSANPNVRRGIQLEDEARQLMEQHLDEEARKNTFGAEAMVALQNKLGELLIPVCAEHTAWKVLRASFDGLTTLNKPAELKCPSTSVFNEVKKNGLKSPTVQMYLTQLETQQVVAEANEGWLAFYNPADKSESDRLIVFPHTLTDDRRSFIVDRAQWFWNLVQTDTPPPIDPDRDIYVPSDPFSYERWKMAAKELREAQRILDQLKSDGEPALKALEEAKAKLLPMLGEFRKGICSGVRVCRYEQKGSIDYERFLNENFAGKYTDEQLERYRKPASQRSKISVTDAQHVDPETIGAKSDTENYWI